MSYPVHTVETAPEAAKEFLAGATKTYGFLPNLFGVMASAPPLVKTYGAVGQLFNETSFSPTERQVVLLSVSAENECGYCVAAHSVIASMQGVRSEVIEALRQGAPLPDRKLEALRQFTTAVVVKRGHPSRDDIAAFLNVGYTEANILEVVLGVGLKTISNYTNHIAATPLDPAFASAKWAKSF